MKSDSHLSTPRSGIAPSREPDDSPLYFMNVQASDADMRKLSRAKLVYAASKCLRVYLTELRCTHEGHWLTIGSLAKRPRSLRRLSDEDLRKSAVRSRVLPDGSMMLILYT